MTPETDTVPACPDCGSQSINRKNPTHAASRADSPDCAWRCSVCGHQFDEPEQQERQIREPGHPDGKALWSADQDAYPDGGRDGYQEWVGEECPECGVEITQDALRYNGYAWEHKNPEAHPQAGHHVIQETVRTAGKQADPIRVELLADLLDAAREWEHGDDVHIPNAIRRLASKAGVSEQVIDAATARYERRRSEEGEGQ